MKPSDRGDGRGRADGDAGSEPAYEAFVSYSHSAHDTRVARGVQRFLEGYRIPRPLRAAAGRARLGRLFRDADELAAGDALGARIERAIRGSRFLIAVCSPAAAASPWVNREIEEFAREHGPGRIIAVLANGEPADAFPPALTAALARDGGAPDEPVAADLRPGVPLRRRRAELLRVAAPLVGCTLDELARRRRARTARLAGCAVAGALAVGAGLGAVVAAQQRETGAERSAHLVETAQGLRDEGKRMEAIQVALEALDAGGGEAAEAAARTALAEALGAYRDTDAWEPCYTVGTVREAPYPAFSPDGSWFALAQPDGSLNVFDVASGRPVGTLAAEELGDGFDQLFGFGESALVGSTDEGLACIDVMTGEVRWKIASAPLAIEELDRETACLLCAGDGDGGDEVRVIDLESGTVTRTVPLGRRLSGTLPCLAAQGSTVAVACGNDVIVVNLEDGGVRAGTLEGNEPTAIELSGDHLVTVSSSLDADASQAGAATFRGIDSATLGQEWERSMSWGARELDYSSLPFNTRALLQGRMRIDGVDGHAVMVTAGAHVMALDPATGETADDLETDAPVVGYTALGGEDAGIGAAVFTQTGSSYAYLPGSNAQPTAVSATGGAGDIGHADTLFLDGECYLLAASTERTGEIGAFRLAVAGEAPDEPGVTQLTEGAASDAARTADGGLAVVDAGARTIRFIDATTLDETGAFGLDELGLGDVDASDLQVLAHPDDGGRVVLVSVGGGELSPRLWAINLEEGSVGASWAFPYARDGLPYGETAVSSVRNGHIAVSIPTLDYLALVDARTLDTVYEFDTAESGVVDALQADENRFLLVFDSGLAQLYDTEVVEGDGTVGDGASIDASSGFPVNCIEVPDGGGSFAVATGDGALELHDAKTGDVLWSTSFDVSGAVHIAFSPDGRSVWAQDGGQDIRVFDAGTGERTATVSDIAGIDDIMLALDVSDDGGRVFVYETDTLSRWARVLERTGDGYAEIARIPDADAVSGGGDGVVIVPDSAGAAYAQPVYGEQELREQAQEAVHGHELTAEERRELGVD